MRDCCKWDYIRIDLELENGNYAYAKAYAEHLAEHIKEKHM